MLVVEALVKSSPGAGLFAYTVTVAARATDDMGTRHEPAARQAIARVNRGNSVILISVLQTLKKKQ